MADITNAGNPVPKSRSEEALSFILENAFRSGFGTLGKTELDLILFTTLVKYGGRRGMSDYELSKYLQITPRRVTNLREHASVKYLSISRAEAIERFVEKSASARIDGLYIDIPIGDIAVRNEIEAMLEEDNILLHSQLNPKVFRIRIDDFVEVVIQIEAELGDGESTDDVRKRLLDGLKALSAASDEIAKAIRGASGDKALTLEALKKSLIKGGLSFGISALASLIPGGSIVADLAKRLIENVAGRI
jgi:hypothetical protein